MDMTTASGIPIFLARVHGTPFEVKVNPFPLESNQSRLHKAIDQIRNRQTVRHNVVEVDMFNLIWGRDSWKNISPTSNNNAGTSKKIDKMTTVMRRPGNLAGGEGEPNPLFPTMLWTALSIRRRLAFSFETRDLHFFSEPHKPFRNF